MISDLVFSQDFFSLNELNDLKNDQYIFYELQNSYDVSGKYFLRVDRDIFLSHPRLGCRSVMFRGLSSAEDKLKFSLDKSYGKGGFLDMVFFPKRKSETCATSEVYRDELIHVVDSIEDGTLVSLYYFVHKYKFGKSLPLGGDCKSKKINSIGLNRDQFSPRIFYEVVFSCDKNMYSSYIFFDNKVNGYAIKDINTILE